MWVTFLAIKHLLEDHRGNGTAPWESHTERGPKEVKTSAAKRLKISKVLGTNYCGTQRDEIQG